MYHDYTQFVKELYEIVLFLLLEGSVHIKSVTFIKDYLWERF